MTHKDYREVYSFLMKRQETYTNMRVCERARVKELTKYITMISHLLSKRGISPGVYYERLLKRIEILYRDILTHVSIQ